MARDWRLTLVLVLMPTLWALEAGISARLTMQGA